MKTLLKMLLMIAMLIAVLIPCAMADSFYCAPNTTAVAVNIGPRLGPRTIKNIYAYTATASSTITVQQGGTVAKVNVAQATVSGDLYVPSTTGFSASDAIVLAHPDGTLEYTTLNGAPGTTNLTIATSLSKVAEVGSRIWKLSTAANYQMPWIYNGTTNATVVPMPMNIGGDLFRAYGVPLRVSCSATNATLNVTVSD